MMATIIDGKEVSKIVNVRIQMEVKQLVEEREIIPGLAAVLVGEDPASQYYVGSKRKRCKKLGMNSQLWQLPKETGQDELTDLINNLNEDINTHGILVQLPLPEHIDQHEIMDIINPDKDVDGFTSKNIAKLYRGEECFEPCTPKGILTLLDHYQIPTEGRNAVIIGRSEIVGKPLAQMLMDYRRNATVTVCHSRTKNLNEVCAQADILVAAIGRANYVTTDMVKERAVVIDVGINRVEDASKKKGYRIVGDVNYERVEQKASYITPVPGGVGPMTIISLMDNTLQAAKNSVGGRQ